MNEMMWVQVGFALVAGVVIAILFVRQSRLVADLERDRTDARRDKTAAQDALNVMVAAAGVSGPLVRQLPVIQTKAAESMCDNCEHFDLEEGQAQFREHRAFAQVTQIVSPAMMSQTARYDDAGNLLVDDEGVLQKTDPAVPHKTRWDEFGACAVHGEGRWKGDKCDKYARVAETLGNTNAAGG